MSKTKDRKMNLIEGDNVRRRHHIDKGITNIAFILKTKKEIISVVVKLNEIYNVIRDHQFTYLKINWQIEKVISTPMIFINSCQQHL